MTTLGKAFCPHAVAYDCPSCLAAGVTLDPRPAPAGDERLREAAVHALAGAMSLEVPVMPTRRESARAWTEWFDQFAANLLDHPWSDEQRVALRAALATLDRETQP